MENKKRKKVRRTVSLEEGGFRRAEKRFLPSHDLPREKSEGPYPLGEGGAQRAEDRSLSSHHFSQQ